MNQQELIISLDGNNKPTSAIINGILFVIGTFMNIDDKSYKVFIILNDSIRFNDKYDVILSVGLKNSTKKTIVLFLPKIHIG